MNSVFTNSDYINMCEMYRSGNTEYDIAEHFSTDQGTISRILKKNGVKTSNSRYYNTTLKKQYFKAIDSYDKAYFFGLMFSKGVISNTNRHNCIRIEVKNEEKIILDVLKKYLHIENPLQHRNKTSSFLSIYSSEFIDNFMRIVECVNNSAGYAVKSIERELRHDFIRGLFDGRGFVTKSNRIFGFCGDISFVTDVKNMIIDEIRAKNVKIHKNNSSYKVQWGSKTDISRFFDYIYMDKRDCYIESIFNNMKLVVIT